MITLAVVVLAGLLILLPVGCFTVPPVTWNASPPDSWYTLHGDTPYAVVRVFFATDRDRTEDPQPAKVFGRGRGEISYGTCQVSIPRDHRMGMLETPSIWRLHFRKTPKKDVVLLETRIEEKTAYFTELSVRVQSTPRKNAFIFVHGYNVTFEDAARRTAQMAYDLAFSGAPVFYSWPSQGAFAAYPVDEQNVEWTETHFTRFLEEFVTMSSAEDIYLIAHSMGNRVLTRSLATILAKRPEMCSRFRDVILAAPDIDADVFKHDIAPRIVSTNRVVTLYASSRDKALLASKDFHGYPRVGDSGDGLVVMPGIETIDATSVDTSFLGHSYFAQATSVLADMFYLIREGKRPWERFALIPVEDTQGGHWMFRR